MIFVILGSQKFQFNRLLKEIDNLIEKGAIKDKVFAQIGYSTYIPKFYEYKEFLDTEYFRENIKQADLIITHGGTGAIVTSIKESKKVIAVPRLAEYGEHVDNHQKEIVEMFKGKKYIESIEEIKELERKILKIKNKKNEKFISNSEIFINKIEECLV